MKLKFTKISEKKDEKFIEFKGSQLIGAGKADFKISVLLDSFDGADLQEQIDLHKGKAIDALRKVINEEVE